MKKFKGYTDVKHCPDGERYSFKKGVCVVPGMRICRHPVKITLMEFNNLCKEVAL